MVRANLSVEDEKHAGLISRIASKAGLSRKEATSLQEGKEGSGLVYEYEGSRWSLEDGMSTILA